MTMLSGIFPPIPTPFNKDGEFDKSKQQKLIHTLTPDVNGFVILGSNGEAAYLSEAERLATLESAREAIPTGLPMIAGTGGEATRLVIERNLSAHAAGADFALVLPAFYFKGGMTEAVLENHYLSIADASPMPILLYNIPQVTGLSLSPTLIAKLAQHKNIVGIKDSSGNINALTEIMRQVPDDFTVLTGNAPTLLAALSLGAKGGILAVANVAAKAYQTLKAQFDAGNIEEARALQLKMNPLALAVTSNYGVPGLKATLALQGNSAGYPRAPLQELQEAAIKDIETILQALD